MDRISREEFIGRFRNKQLDLAQLRRDNEARGVLGEAGLSVETIASVDDGNGRIDTPRELDALFEVIERVDPDFSSNRLVLSDDAGQLTASGRVYNVLSVRFLPADGGLPLDPDPLDRPDGARPLALSGPVGSGMANRHDDVLSLQQSLARVGFNLEPDGDFGPQTGGVIRVYRAMLQGLESANQASDKVRPTADDDVFFALSQPSPPGWCQVPDSGEGFRNNDQLRDNFDWGASHAVQTLIDSGVRYSRSYLRTHPSAAPICTNDMSRRNGGNTSSHASHEAGLDLDLRLPNTDGTGGTRVGYRSYDRNACYAQIAAFAQDPRVARVLIGDSVLIQLAQRNEERWTDKLLYASDHRDHCHIDFHPPKIALA